MLKVPCQRLKLLVYKRCLACQSPKMASFVFCPRTEERPKGVSNEWPNVSCLVGWVEEVKVSEDRLYEGVSIR